MIIVVPFGQPASSSDTCSPPKISILVPTSSSRVFVIISVLETAATDDNASPLKPRVIIASKSCAEEILLVAWLTKASGTSSLAIPQPLSVILMYLTPPF